MTSPLPNTAQRSIEADEQARDLRAQLAGLGTEDEQDIQFIEWSPGRRMVTIWNMQSGEEVTLPNYQARSALNTPNPAGGWMWTTNKEAAPAAFVPSTPCFLHPDSPHRDLLRSLGITATCMTMLADEDSAEKHANRHPSRWARLKRELDRQERDGARAEQRMQTEAMMKLAGMNLPVPATASVLTCECGWETDAASKNPAASLRMHKMSHPTPVETTPTEGDS